MEDGLAGNFARSLLSATNGDLWIGTASAGGLHRLRAGQLRGFELPAGSGLVRAMALDASGALWAGTAGGTLLRVAGDVLSDETAGPVPRQQTIRCLHATPDGSLWVGYGGSGVGRLKGGKFSEFRSEQGISDDYISQILDDGEGRLWFAGNRGIFYVPEKEFADQAAGRIARVRPVAFGRDEGLPTLQASREAWPGAARGRDGSLWIAMQTGLAVVHPQALRPNPAPPVVIETVSVGGQEIAAYDAATAKSGSGGTSGGPIDLQRAGGATLQIAPGREQLAIAFTALSFASPRHVAFRFKLEGLETEWVEAETRRVAYYSHLPPGKFRFRVTASDHEGNWNAAGATLDLEVLPYFWQTWWFRILAVLSLMATVGAAVRYVEVRKRRVQVARAEREGAIERERARIAQDIHDDLGASLTEITLLSELAQGGDGPPEEMQTDLRKIAARTRHLTRALDATVWAVNPKNDTLESLVTYTCNHAEDFLKPAEIRCRLEVPDRLPRQVLSAAVRHNVFLIVKEALHNVVKHAGAMEVFLRIATRADGLTLVIEDNGKGFSPDAAATTVEARAGSGSTRRRQGHGLLNMQKRAEEIGGRFALRSQPGKGTRIQLEVSFARR
jgi:signal transduction histidine kinase